MIQRLRAIAATRRQSASLEIAEERAGGEAKSVDIVLDEMRRTLAAQQAHVNSIDTKASFFLASASVDGLVVSFLMHHQKLGRPMIGDTYVQYWWQQILADRASRLACRRQFGGAVPAHESVPQRKQEPSNPLASMCDHTRPKRRLTRQVSAIARGGSA